MKFFDFIIELLIASLLFFIAPVAYSSLFCILYIVLYTYQLYGLFRLQKTDKSFLSFNVLLFIMLALVTYLVPILYLLDYNTQIITIITYDDRYILKSLFITSVAVSCYKLGYFKGEQAKALPDSYFSDKAEKNVLDICKVLVVITAIVFWWVYTIASSSGERDISGLAVTLINSVYIFALIFAGYSNLRHRLPLARFVVRHRLIFACTVFVVLSMLIIGDRYTPICLGVTSLFVINRFVHRFTISQFILILVIGMVVLVGISLTRNMDKGEKKSSILNEENKTVYFQDLIPINLDFYLGLQWKDNHGYFKPERFFYIIAYPIPFIPSYIANNFLDGEVSSGMMLTIYNKSQTGVNDDSGLGTHAIVDVYMSWGWIGVIMLFYLFGRLVGVSSKRSNNFYYLLIYGCFLSRAIYIPRETLFVPYRDIVYILILASLILPKKS